MGPAAITGPGVALYELVPAHDAPETFGRIRARTRSARRYLYIGTKKKGARAELPFELPAARSLVRRRERRERKTFKRFGTNHRPRQLPEPTRSQKLSAAQDKDQPTRRKAAAASMAAIVQPLGEPTFEDTHREIRRELEHGLDAMGKEQPGLAETCYAAALERASALDPDSRLTANCLGYLAKACAAQRKHKMAATMHERQLLILKELAGRGEASALDRASVLLELVAIYGTLGKEDEASKLRGEVDALMEGVPEPRPPSSGDDSSSDDDDDDEQTAEAAYIAKRSADRWDGTFRLGNGYPTASGQLPE